MKVPTLSREGLAELIGAGRYSRLMTTFSFFL